MKVRGQLHASKASSQ